MRFIQIIFVSLTVIVVGYFIYSWYKKNTYEYKMSALIDEFTQFQNQFIDKNSPVYFELEKMKEKLYYILEYNRSFSPMPIFSTTLAELSVELLNNPKDVLIEKIRQNYPSLRIGLVYNCKKEGKMDVCSYESRVLNKDISYDEKKLLVEKASKILNKEALEYLKEKNLKEIRLILQILKEMQR